MAGGRHVQFLVEKNILQLAPSATLDSVYPSLLPSSPPTTKAEKKRPEAQPSTGTAGSGSDEKMLLSQETGKVLARSLDIPELEIELERAIWQVERSISQNPEDPLEKEKKR